MKELTDVFVFDVVGSCFSRENGKKFSYLCDSSGNNNPTWKCEREGVVQTRESGRPPQNESGLSAPLDICFV